MTTLSFQTCSRPLILKTQSRTECMECDKPPTIEVLWAEGMAHAWFCDKCFEEWKQSPDKMSNTGTYEGDIVSTRKIDGEASKKWNEPVSKSFSFTLDRSKTIIEKGRHADSPIDPETFLRDFTKSMNNLLVRYRFKELSKQEALDKAEFLILNFVEKSILSAKLRLAKLTKTKIEKLPPEYIHRLNRVAKEYRQDFELILNDAH